MLLITAQPIRNLRTPASADMNKRGFLEQASPPPPPPLFPFPPIPYPLPLSTPATQANTVFEVGVLAPEEFWWKIFLGEDLEPLVVLVRHLHGKLFVIHRW